MAAAFYNVYISPREGVTREDVQKQMNLAVDWFRYDPKNYVIYTTSDAAKWQARLKPLVEGGGHLFIVKIDPRDRQGWMSRKFWDWLKQDRPTKSK
jgi:hypothetical protein